MRSIALAAPLLVMAAWTGAIHASGPIAVYAVIDKVSFAFDADHRETIRIAGVFSVAEGTAGTYSTPKKGYLYFALPTQDRELARREWTDLQSVAGTRQVVGFGSGWGAFVHVNAASEGAKAPEESPMGNGMIRVNSDHPQAIALLAATGR